jgi:excisionase family DNA binding protein
MFEILCHRRKFYHPDRGMSPPFPNLTASLRSQQPKPNPDYAETVKGFSKLPNPYQSPSTCPKSPRGESKRHFETGSKREDKASFLMEHSRGQLLKAREAARYLGVSLNTLYRMERKGHLSPFRTPGGHRRYSLDMLDRYLEQSRSRFNNQSGTG